MRFLRTIPVQEQLARCNASLLREGMIDEDACAVFWTWSRTCFGEAEPTGACQALGLAGYAVFSGIPAGPGA